ncbi:MAG: ABC transporter permease [Bacteroidetes bacterium]|nr:MAG: ABC transporter permease [Bacteroidota bacterium]
MNISGLALGMASAILILLFLRFETTYDHWHDNADRIFRVGTDLQILEQKEVYAVSSAALAPAMVNEFSEFESFLRIFHANFFLRDIIYRVDEKAFYERDIFAVDSTFFDFFSYRFVEGNAENALTEPFSIVLTESLARKIFGNAPAEGQTIRVDDAGHFKVTAVVEDSPINTHFHFEGLFSISTLYQLEMLFSRAFGPGVNWPVIENTQGSTIVWSYLKVHPGFDPKEFTLKNWPRFHEKYILPLKEKHQMDIQPFFQSLKNIHTDDDLLYDRSTEKIHLQVMNRQMVSIFFVIALFLILVASINYTNIAISHLSKRRKEMAIVKVLGSGSKQLFVSFFTESFITAFLGLITGLLFIELLLPSINEFLTINLSILKKEDLMTVLIMFSVFLLTALLSGLFPAAYFARTPVQRLLMKQIKAGRRTILFKRILVTIQFTIAAFMISVSFLVYQQLRHMEEMDTGYNYHNIGVIELNDRYSKLNANRLDSLFKDQPEILRTAKTNYVFSSFPVKNTLMMVIDGKPVVRSFNTVQTKGDYLDLMGLTITGEEGQIDPGLLDRGKGVFINQAFARAMNLEDPVGKTVTTHFQFLEGRMRAQRTILGVMDDVHYALLNEPVQPMIIIPALSLPNYLTVRFQNSNRQKQTEMVRNLWSEFNPANPLEFYFIEDVVNDFFANQRKISRFFGYFAWMCIVISFLGIYGITAYNMEQRRAEIGIRKVMGAGGTDIFLEFFRTYSVLMVIACFTGITLGYLALERWVQEFAFSMKVGISPYIHTILLISATVILAIGIHAYRSIYINPTDALKCE